MPYITAGSSIVTLINVFTVETENQDRLVELLTQVTSVSTRYAPGFVSSSLHRSINVTMYAQWRSVEDYQAMRNNTPAHASLEEAARLATFEPGMYEVVETFEPASG